MKRIICTLMLATFSIVMATSIRAQTVNLPLCGADPSVNTLAWQQAINNAVPGSTLALPSGVCVVAKCDVAKGRACYGATGGRIVSAVDVGNKTNLTFIGAADGTSVLKLDPNPPPVNGYHAYCGATHALSIQQSSFITLRGFTIDGSDGELPEDTNQCAGGGGRIDEHMHDVSVVDSTDLAIDHMILTKAHGDGLNLIGNLGRTERISVTNTEFLANDRAGVTFQRNVGYVTICGNHFRNSGEDQDLDMEPTGGPNELGPYEVNIDNNRFERIRPGITVTLGSASAQRSNGIRFTHNSILPANNSSEGGCIFVYTADNTTIANNEVVGAGNCVTLEAQKVTGLVVDNNILEGYANMRNSQGFFVPSPVIRIVDRVVNQKTADQDCGAPPKQPCPYLIYYPDQITITNNTIIQQVQYSPAVKLSNPDALVVAGNNISHTRIIPPLYPFDIRYPIPRPDSIDSTFGVTTLPSYGYYLNERTVFQEWSITGNGLNEFADGIRIAPIKAGVTLSSATVSNNAFVTAQNNPQGIWLVGAPTVPQNGFINNLTIDGNAFGCGFAGPETNQGILPPNAYVRPSGQAHTGDIGFTASCP
jgi:hypothetical protein